MDLSPEEQLILKQREAAKIRTAGGYRLAPKVDAQVESSWQRLEPLVPDALFKIRLRAFGWFVLDRYC
jgi:hypothetical protein